MHPIKGGVIAFYFNSWSVGIGIPTAGGPVSTLAMLVPNT